MKKFFTLCFSSLLVASVTAQVCTPKQLPEPKFDPNPEEIDCFRKGQQVDQVIYFKMPAAAGNYTVQYMKIDSLTNLPDGLTVELNKGWGAQYSGNEDGCLKVSGVSNDISGQYRLGLYVRLKVTILPTELSGDLYEIATANQVDSAEKYIFWVRLTGQGESCPCIDKSNPRRPVGDVWAYTGSETNCAPVSVRDIGTSVNNLVVSPNPFSSNAVVKFNSDEADTYTLRITNVIGKVMTEKTVEAALGSNTIDINRNELSAGTYLLSLSNAKGLTTKRFIIE